MSEEDTTPTAPAATEAAGNGAAAADTKPEGKGPRRKKEDDKPIEELYDLSKPIPKVRRHNDSCIVDDTPAVFVFVCCGYSCCCCFVSSTCSIQWIIFHPWIQFFTHILRPFPSPMQPNRLRNPTSLVTKQPSRRSMTSSKS